MYRVKPKIDAIVICTIAAAVAFTASACFGGDGRGDFFGRGGKPPPGWVRTASVHDPSIFRDRDGKYYIVGTHLASAESSNLISWRQTDSLRRGIDAATADKIRAWNRDDAVGKWFDYLWAPDIVYNRKMRKYCLYLSANGDDWQSNIVMLAADKPTGPFEFCGSVVYGGFSADNWQQTDVPRVLRTVSLPERYVDFGVANRKWGLKFPNCIDPCVFYDDDGRLWMSYGSWSGGIFLLALDEKTGLRDEKVRYATNEHSDAYFGRKIAGGHYVSGEGSYICKIGQFYWLFVSYGKLDAKGGYNVRVFRSARPTGPYLDRRGNNALYDTYRLNFNDGVGVRLFGAYSWKVGAEGMVAQGHNSAIVDKDGRAFIVYHTRTTAGHEGHYIRIHQLFLNKDGWLLAAPYRFRGERLEPKGLRRDAIIGDYDIIIHRLDVDYAHLGVATPQRITLRADRTIVGAFTGRWEAEHNSPYVNLVLDGPDADTYRGIALIQAIDSTNAKTTVITALGDRTQLSLWASRSTH